MQVIIMYKRIFLIVFDSLGIGNGKDAKKFNDVGSNTLNSVLSAAPSNLPCLKKLGFLNTLTMNNKESEAYYTIARPKNKGKDSLSGHYEIMGIETNIAYKNFKDDFHKNEKPNSKIKWNLRGPK